MAWSGLTARLPSRVALCAPSVDRVISSATAVVPAYCSWPNVSLFAAMDSDKAHHAHVIGALSALAAD